MTGSVEFKKITKKQSWQVFDAAAHRVLGVSGEEFVKLFESGAYDAERNNAVMQVAMLRPSGR